MPGLVGLMKKTTSGLGLTFATTTILERATVGKKRKGNVVIPRRKAEKSRELLLEDSWLLHDREFSSNMIFYDKMATVVLFWNINMAAVTSCANAR